jgi:hypothetical protein
MFHNGESWPLLLLELRNFVRKKLIVFSKIAQELLNINQLSILHRYCRKRYDVVTPTPFRLTSAGVMAWPHLGQIVFSEAKTFCVSIFFRLGMLGLAQPGVLWGKEIRYGRD